MILLSTSLTVVLTSIVVFLIVIIFLVVMLLYARKKLIPQGAVQLKVNDKKQLFDAGIMLAYMPNYQATRLTRQYKALA